MPKIVVLRWGHRPQRDQRLTTHVALIARVFGAHGFLLSDIEDKKIKNLIIENNYLRDYVNKGILGGF